MKRNIIGMKKNGWYRYNSYFALPVYDDNENIERYNVFHASC